MWAILVPTFIFAAASGVCAQEITPSRVFRHTLEVVNSIHALRRPAGVTAAPRKPGVQAHKLPIHVYAKCLEVLEKVARYQVALGLAAARVGQIPIRDRLPNARKKCFARIPPWDETCCHRCHA